MSLYGSSLWSQWFEHGGLLELIRVDIHRTYQENDFFTKIHTQKMMERILLIWAIEHPQCSYRQGMNELLAIIIMALNKDYNLQLPDDVPSSLSAIINMQFLEHDAFTIFDHLMVLMWSYFASAATELSLSSSGVSMGVGGSLVYILLKEVDPQLYSYLLHANISPSAYLFKWLRLLFSREFALHQVIRIWDFLFANFELIDFVCVAMLLNIRHDLLKADPQHAVTLLTHYPPLEENIHCLLRMGLNTKRGLEALVQFKMTVGSIDNAARELIRALRFDGASSSPSINCALGVSVAPNSALHSPSSNSSSTSNSAAPTASVISATGSKSSPNLLYHLSSPPTAHSGSPHSAFSSAVSSPSSSSSAGSSSSPPLSSAPVPHAHSNLRLPGHGGGGAGGAGASGSSSLTSKRASLMGFEFSSSAMATSSASGDKNDVSAAFQTSLSEEDKVFLFPRVSLTSNDYNENYTYFNNSNSDSVPHFKLSGWLLKRGGGLSALGRKSYKVRWFTLHDTVLSYYESPSSVVPLKNSRIFIRRSLIQIVDDEKLQFTIIPQSLADSNNNTTNDDAGADNDDDDTGVNNMIGRTAPMTPDRQLTLNNTTGIISNSHPNSNANNMMGMAGPAAGSSSGTLPSSSAVSQALSSAGAGSVSVSSNHYPSSSQAVNPPSPVHIVNDNIHRKDSDGSNQLTAAAAAAAAAATGGKKSKLRTYELYAEDRSSLIQWVGALTLASQS